MGSPVAQGQRLLAGAVQLSQGFAGCGRQVRQPSIYGASLRVSRPHAQVLLPVLKGEGQRGAPPERRGLCPLSPPCGGAAFLQGAEALRRGPSFSIRLSQVCSVLGQGVQRAGAEDAVPNWTPGVSHLHVGT